MPELPEVETIRRGLEKYLLQHTIDDIEVLLAKQFIGDAGQVISATVTGVRRFGKGLLIDLDNGFSLAVHVKMTGQLIYRTEGETLPQDTIGELPNKWTHIIFNLIDPEGKKAYLYFNDQRQFGWIRVVKTEEATTLPFFTSLGKEPLRDLTLEHFNAIVSSSKQAIKTVIMDQTKIAGVGNIYANDALFKAKIHPKRSANSLSIEEKKRLFTAIEEVLQKGLEVGGASEWHYRDVLGGKGQYQNFFLVYNKEKQPCPTCGHEIEKVKLGGRGTYFCSHCQK